MISKKNNGPSVVVIVW